VAAPFGAALKRIVVAQVVTQVVVQVIVAQAATIPVVPIAIITVVIVQIVGVIVRVTFGGAPFAHWFVILVAAQQQQVVVQVVVVLGAAFAVGAPWSTGFVAFTSWGAFGSRAIGPAFATAAPSTSPASPASFARFTFGSGLAAFVSGRFAFDGVRAARLAHRTRFWPAAAAASRSASARVAIAGLKIARIDVARVDLTLGHQRLDFVVVKFAGINISRVDIPIHGIARTPFAITIASTASTAASASPPSSADTLIVARFATRISAFAVAAFAVAAFAVRGCFAGFDQFGFDDFLVQKLDGLERGRIALNRAIFAARLIAS
jgi:hypothetical protein